MKNFKFEQIKILFLLSILIIIFHFVIMNMGNFPGGNYGMAPFILILGLPILIFICVIGLFLLNYFKINLSQNKVALCFILSYNLILGKEMISDEGMFQLFFYPSIIALAFYISIKFLLIE